MANSSSAQLAEAPIWKNRVGTAAQLRQSIRELPVTIERISASQLQLTGATAFTRVTTILLLEGESQRGTGEDVSYSSDTHAELVESFTKRDDLIGTWTIETLSDHLDANPLLTPGGIRMSDKPQYHRWAIESAALDLALRQQETNLSKLMNISWNDVQVSLSMGLGSPPSADILKGWLDRDKRCTFKIDASQEWSSALITELAEVGTPITTVDMKALYSGEWIDNDYPVDLYQAVGLGLPHVLIEDARINAKIENALGPDGLKRLAWDYPITAPEDVPGLESSSATFSTHRPRAINIKPSRFGSIARLLDTITLCDEHDIPCYSGGQFELGIGRTHVQSITSLCFPDGPNDCAPVMFHGANPASLDAPTGPVSIPEDHVGFGWPTPTRAQVV